MALSGGGIAASIPLLTTSCAKSEFDKINSPDDVYNAIKGLDWSNPQNTIGYGVKTTGITYFRVVNSTQPFESDDDATPTDVTMNMFVGYCIDSEYTIAYIYANMKDVKVNETDGTKSGTATFGVKGWSSAEETADVSNQIGQYYQYIENQYNQLRGQGLTVKELSTLENGLKFSRTDVAEPFGKIEEISEITWTNY